MMRDDYYTMVGIDIGKKNIHKQDDEKGIQIGQIENRKYEKKQ